MVAACLVVPLAAGCDAGAPPSPVPASPPEPTADRSLGSGPQPGSAAATPTVTTAPRPPTPKPVTSTSTGWTVTVYYTAVERFHDGRATQVTGCPRLECTRGDTNLGTYPADFVQAVRAEGTGRTAAGRYLNWSHDTGFWLDEAPRDAAGRPLRPWQSAAADPGVLRAGTRFAIVDCGRDDDGGPIDATVCARLRSAQWLITDEFTPGLGGERHIDVYIGEETQRDFKRTAWYTTLNRATLGF
jgi:hypothetical protein